MFSGVLLERLKELHPKSIDLSLDRVERLLAALNHPELRLPPVVHVAGTNGKGSFIAFLRAIAEGLGKRVQVYTSPHLVNFHERIALPGPMGAAPIAEEDLVDCLARAEAANQGELITLFEITTAAAFLAFAETPADLLLLETGLGGRLDATNVVQSPLLTAITPISIDHVGFLGSTISAIAAEKAGIIKPGIPCIVGPQEPEALEIIEAKASPLDAPLTVCGRDFSGSESGNGFVFETAARKVELPMPCLAGRHQLDNAATAIAAAAVIFPEALTRDALLRGMTKAEWPARLERLSPGALHAHVGEGTEIWLDGGHNPAGGKAVAEAIAALGDRGSRPVHLVWGMMETKDAQAVISPFKGLVERIYTVPIPEEENAFAAEALAEIAAGEGFNVTAAMNVPHALLLSQAAFSRPGRVLICGSLYLAGHVLKLHNAQRLTLPNVSAYRQRRSLVSS